MTSNIAVKITADVTDLQVQFKLAQQESAALSKEFNNLAQMARSSGSTMRSEVQAAMQESAAAMLEAKAQATALSSELKNAQGGASSFSSGLNEIKSGLASLGLAMSVQQLVQWGEKTEENAASLSHEAEVLSLTTEQYEAFRLAATDSGVSTDTADTAIKRFNKSLGDAQEGIGPAAKAFNELGVSSHQSTAEALAQVSAMMLTKSATDQQRLSVELMSRNGAEMIPLYHLWALGAAALTAEYQAQRRSMAGVADAAEKTSIKTSQLDEKFSKEFAPAAERGTKVLNALKLAMLDIATFSDNGLKIDINTGDIVNRLKELPAKPVQIIAPTLQERIEDLNQLTPKLNEIKVLNENIATAEGVARDERHSITG